jgi:hypothetical protein
VLLVRCVGPSNLARHARRSLLGQHKVLCVLLSIQALSVGQCCVTCLRRHSVACGNYARDKLCGPPKRTERASRQLVIQAAYLS